MRSSLLLATASATYVAAQTMPSNNNVVSLLLPWSDSGKLVASVVTAAPSATVYAIGCQSETAACGPSCALTTSVTITEGVSTLAYTWTDADAALATTASMNPQGGYQNLTQDIITVDCALAGGVHATQAVCTGINPIHGYLNGTTETTTLPTAQITYVPVTITAGATKLASIASQETGSASSTTTSGSSSLASGSGSSVAAASASATAGAAPLMQAVGVYAMAGVAGVAAVAML